LVRDLQWWVGPAHRGGRRAAVPFGIALLLVLGTLAALSDARGATPPSSDQLLAAAIHAADARQAKAAPGGWWDDAPEFNAKIDPDSPSDRLDFVVSHIAGRPDGNPAQLACEIALFPTPAASAARFTASLGDDAQAFGGAIAGPKIGDQSRYRHESAGLDHGAGAALRFQFGRYLVRIDAIGGAANIAPDALAALARIVIQRLTDLDAGRLAAPALPGWATAMLPPADGEFPAVLGTALIAREAGAWIWSSQASNLVISRRLAALLGRGGKEPVAFRRYGLAGQPDHAVEALLIPFAGAGAARGYLAALAREDSRYAGPTIQAGDLTIYAPIPDVDPAYRVVIALGRFAAMIRCYAPFAPTTSACRDAVGDLAAKFRKRAPAGG
jgi:hypothetical protein